MTPKQGFWARTAMAIVAVLGMAAAVWMYQRHVDRREPLWRTDAVAWSHVPVRVYFEASDYQPYAADINAAMALWNKAAGCQLLVRTHDEGEADVAIRPLGGDPCGRPPAHADSPMWTCYLAPRALTETKALGDSSGEMLRFEHEGGHWLGLDDRRDGSIMEPVRNDPQPGDAPPAALISGFLADAVRARWCHE